MLGGRGGKLNISFYNTNNIVNQVCKNTVLLYTLLTLFTIPQGPQSRHWCFTINNPVPDDAIDILLTDYIIISHEIGDDGTPHLQGYIIFNKIKRLTQVKKLMPRAHLEIKFKDSTPKQASHYCKKPVLGCKCIHCIKAKDYVSSYLEYGILPVNTTSHNIWEQAKQSAIEGNFDEIPANMLIRYYHSFKRIHQDNPIQQYNLIIHDNIWVYAPTGYGKSYYARKKYPDFYPKSPNKWFVGYQNQDTILCDDFAPTQCKYLHYYLKIWSDIYPFLAETKGGGMLIRPKHIVLTSQYTIQESFEDQRTIDAISRRFRVKYLKHWQTKKLPVKQLIYNTSQRLFSSQYNTNILTPRIFNKTHF